MILSDYKIHHTGRYICRFRHGIVTGIDIKSRIGENQPKQNANRSK